jgi:uncharacterized protein YukE
MEGKEVSLEDRVEQDETESVENVEERRFKVGELVEYWAGAWGLRAGRTDGSGEAAWVKKDYGGGNYGIQMVGNTRGKLRQVQWRQMYKDGTFNKGRSSETGKRVRTKERMREIEEAKAEAKFAGEVKVRDHELKRAEKEKKQMKEQAERCQKMQDLKARQAEKDLSACHKRQLEELRLDHEKRRKTASTSQEELNREQRLQIRDLEKHLKELEETVGRIEGDKDELQKTINRTTDKLHNVREWGGEWKTKYTEQKEKTGEKLEEKIRTLEQKMKGIEKESKQRQKECTLLLARTLSVEDTLNERERELNEQRELRLQVLFLSSPSLLISSDLFFPLQGKRTSRRKKQERKREETNLDEGGSSRERGHPNGKGR